MKYTVEDILATILVSFLLVFTIVIVVWGVSMVATEETITVQGEVMDTTTYDDCLSITLDDGVVYRIRYPDNNIDLSDGSTIVMRLTNYNYFFIDDGIWNEVSIIKIT